MLKFNSILLSLFIFGSLKVSANVDHSFEIAKAQEWANSFERDYPIFIFDRDELHFRFLLASATSPSKEDEEKRMGIIKDFILEKLNLELDNSTLMNIETQLFVAPGSAVAIPFKESYSSDAPYQICTVFANAPNGNSRIEAERITGLNTKEVYKDKVYDQLIIKEDFEVMYLYSMYHEVSHCLDQTFMPEAYKSGYGPSAHDVHASESFAETLAYLQLSKRFSKDIAKARMFYRILYSRYMGEYFAQNPHLGFGDTLLQSGGAIYYLAPSIAEAYSWVSRRKIRPKEVSNDELYSAAETIVNESMLDSRSMSAIARSLADFTAVIAEYSESSIKSPDLFFETYQDLMLYYATTDNWIQKAFDETLEVSLNDNLAPQLPTEELCQSIREHNLDLFQNILTDYRSFLNQNTYSAESRYERYTQLNYLSKTLNRVCLN